MEISFGCEIARRINLVHPRLAGFLYPYPKRPLVSPQPCCLTSVRVTMTRVASFFWNGTSLAFRRDGKVAIHTELELAPSHIKVAVPT